MHTWHCNRDSLKIINVSLCYASGRLKSLECLTVTLVHETMRIIEDCQDLHKNNQMLRANNFEMNLDMARARIPLEKIIDKIWTIF